MEVTVDIDAEELANEVISHMDMHHVAAHVNELIDIDMNEVAADVICYLDLDDLAGALHDKLDYDASSETQRLEVQLERVSDRVAKLERLLDKVTKVFTPPRGVTLTEVSYQQETEV